MLLAATAGLLAVTAFWPRHLPAVAVERLRDYVVADEAFTQLSLVDTYMVMMQEGRQVIQQKALRLKLAIGTLVIAMGVVAVALLVGGCGG